MAIFTSKYAKGEFGRRLHNGGVMKVPFKVKIPTTALDSTDEQVLLLKFPEDGNVTLHRPTIYHGVFDFDTLEGTGAALSQVIGIGDADGVIDTTLVATCIAGRTGATDLLDAGASDLAVNGKYLILDTTAAASTAASGYVSGWVFVDYGYNSNTDDSLT